VTDLSPLQGMPLKDLGLNRTTQLKDLSPLKGMSLEILNLGGSAATDLSPLGEMTVKQLWLNYQPERDAEVLRSIKSLVRINGMSAPEFWKTQKK
jgi:hypothetical protein